LARRDRPGKEGKSFVPQEQLAEAVPALLVTIQRSLYERALVLRNQNTSEPANYEDFKAAVEKGFAFCWWCGSGDCEQHIKEETKATIRCLPLEQPGGTGSCIYCGKPGADKAYFAKAY
jgi:prolyl-tRNA synthetase